LGRIGLGKNCRGRIVWGRIDPGRTDGKSRILDYITSHLEKILKSILIYWKISFPEWFF
jgi:hypothetical protein